jgi:hypothetical protein
VQQEKGWYMMSDPCTRYPVYRRPYFDTYAGRRGDSAKDPHYIYRAAAFSRHDIFSLFILDGGAFLHSAERLGGGQGVDFLAAYQSGRLFGPVTNGEGVDWDKVTPTLLNGDGLTEYYCWLHRLYHLLPFAHQYFLTGDEAWAGRWLRHFEAWRRQGDTAAENSWQSRQRIWAAAARSYLKRCLTRELVQLVRRHLKSHPAANLGWCDMQLSWRFLVFVHSVFLLQRSTTLKSEHWHTIYDSISEHARRIHVEAAAEMKLSTGHGNHFLHKAVALVYFGTLFPELEQAERCLDLGRRIVARHSSEEVTADGASVECSPSYSHFIARLHLEAKLLLEANDRQTIPGLDEVVTKQYHFLFQNETPSGLALPLNDSYHLDAAEDRSIVTSLLPELQWPLQTSCCFPDSSFAVLRQSAFTLFADGADANLHHHHLGKPHIILYRERSPVLVDCGRCSYDRKDDARWYVSPDAHNVVKVESATGRAVEEYKGMGVVKVFGLDGDVHSKSISMNRTVNTGPIRYQWNRRITLSSGQVDITDRVSAEKPARITVLFHFAPSTTILRAANVDLELKHSAWKMRFRQTASREYTRANRMSRAFTETNQETMSPQVQTCTFGRDIQMRTSMSFQ